MEGLSTSAAEQWEDPAVRRRLRRKLLAWFGQNARDLPWRRTSDPYCIWISEIMLQQTQVAAVCGYYERFVAQFPTIQSLAEASESDVLRLWEGLGYYRRARQLHRAAQVLVEQHAGVFPREFDQILALPGIGRYTAGAISSIAFDQKSPIVEANTVRLYSRLLLHGEDPAATASLRKYWEFAQKILPQKNVGALNQALMELGAEVCTPRNPGCERCPLTELCPTFAAGLQDQIPAPKKKKRYEEVTEAAVVVIDQQRVLLRQRGKSERWAGMWDFPRMSLSTDRQQHTQEIYAGVAAQTGATIQLGDRFTTLKHGVTRFRITLHCYQAECLSPPSLREDLCWVAPARLTSYPLSVTGRQISQLVESLF